MEQIFHTELIYCTCKNCGVKFEHLITYSNIDLFMDKPNICPECVNKYLKTLEK